MTQFHFPHWSNADAGALSTTSSKQALWWDPSTRSESSKIQSINPRDFPIPHRYCNSQDINDKLTISKLRLLSSTAQGRKDLWKSSKPCHVGIHKKALAEYYQMSTHLPRFQYFSGFLHHFVLAKVTTSSIRVKMDTILQIEYSQRNGNNIKRYTCIFLYIQGLKNQIVLLVMSYTATRVRLYKSC